MRNIRNVLRLSLGEGLSLRQTSASLEVPFTTVADYVRRAKATGLTWPLPEDMDDDALEARLFSKASRAPKERPLPDWAQVHRELKGGKHVTLMLLWYEYREANPDDQETLRNLFETYAGELAWGPLGHHRALNVLKNPRYAGAFAYGRTQAKRGPEGTGLRRLLPRERWHTLVLDAHPGYISWADYEENLRRLRENAQAYGADRRHGPPREGPALLQGLAVCGRCGGRMSAR